MRRRVLVDAREFTGCVEIIKKPKDTTNRHGVRPYPALQTRNYDQRSYVHNNIDQHPYTNITEAQFPWNPLSVPREIPFDSVDDCNSCFPSLVDPTYRHNWIDNDNDHDTQQNVRRYVNIDDLKATQVRYDEQMLHKHKQMGSQFLSKDNIHALPHAQRHHDEVHRQRKFDLLPVSLQEAISESHLCHSRHQSAVIPPFNHGDFPQKALSNKFTVPTELAVHVLRRNHILPSVNRTESGQNDECIISPLFGDSKSNKIDSILCKDHSKKPRHHQLLRTPRGQSDTGGQLLTSSFAPTSEPLVFPVEVNVKELGKAYDALDKPRSLVTDFGIYCELMKFTVNSFHYLNFDRDGTDKRTDSNMRGHPRIHPFILARYPALVKRTRDLQWMKDSLMKNLNKESRKQLLIGCPLPGLPRKEINAWHSLGLFPQSAQESLIVPIVTTELLLSVLYPENAEEETQVTNKFNTIVGSETAAAASNNAPRNQLANKKDETAATTTRHQLTPAPVVKAGAYILSDI